MYESVQYKIFNDRKKKTHWNYFQVPLIFLNCCFSLLVMLLQRFPLQIFCNFLFNNVFMVKFKIEKKFDFFFLMIESYLEVIICIKIYSFFYLKFLTFISLIPHMLKKEQTTISHWYYILFLLFNPFQL